MTKGSYVKSIKLLENRIKVLEKSKPKRIVLVSGETEKDMEEREKDLVVLSDSLSKRMGDLEKANNELRNEFTALQLTLKTLISIKNA